SVVARHRVKPGPGVCCDAGPITGPPGMRCELLKNGSRDAGARSQPANELRPAVYTDAAGGFCQRVSTPEFSCTEPADVGGLGTGAALNCMGAVGSADA